jgi:hypothetical protein
MLWYLYRYLIHVAGAHTGKKEDPATGEQRHMLRGAILLRAWTGAVLIRVK